ncbi:hypothetical protein BJ944DRAFT_267733 [Cunninghamella echinulata]|nr:hypothetical protein BJ944DRAFT_267733 [Cunninghamella echinulata]
MTTNSMTQNYNDQIEELDEGSSNNDTSCIRCQQPATFMCSSCGIRGPRYCSTECQQLHWKSNHYQTCQVIQHRQQQLRLSRAEINNNINPFHEAVNNWDQ